MTDFAWIVPEPQFPRDDIRGVSSQYILPHHQANGLQGELAGSRLWLVLKSDRAIPLGLLNIDRVEEFCEDYYAGDYLLHADTTSSFRINSLALPLIRTGPSFLNELSAGIHRLSVVHVGALKEYVSDSVQTRLISPSKSLFSTIDFELAPSSSHSLARFCISCITENFSLSQTWTSQRQGNRHPFSDFAAALLTAKGHDPEPLLLLLASFDPLRQLFTVESLEKSNKDDLPFTFQELDPAKIVARKFIKSDKGVSEGENFLAKTEAAEATHQAILKDLATFLIANGLRPHESNSIDLFVFKGPKAKVLEIKSANNDNLISQASKGAFQLALYTSALRSDYSEVDCLLVLQKITDERLQSRIEDALEFLGIRVSIYDSNKSWPERCPGILDF
jgi:hypothetical protein